MDRVNFDAVVIGGGVVGIASARALATARPQWTILLLERNARLGAETSSRNSEVIHAGFYYEPGSKKEELCIEGRQRLYSYCLEKRIPFRKAGKIIIASSKNELGYLEKILAAAERLGIPLQHLDSHSLKAVEPNIEGFEGLYSQETGIVCSETLVFQLECDFKKLSGSIQLNAEVRLWAYDGSKYLLTIIDAGQNQYQVETPIVINSAGHGASTLYTSNLSAGRLPVSVKYVRGHYLQLKEKFRNITNSLIYPVPDVKGGGLGVHLTLDIHGAARLGPDTDWRETATPDHSFSQQDFERLRPVFFELAHRYLPSLEIRDIYEGFVGVRPKPVNNDGKFGDFYIQNEAGSGFPGWINLLGIESPGLTSSLAIGQKVLEII